jgi:ketosteroid isomerase-like protein
MSRENVQLVRRLQPGPEVDLAQVLRDDTLAEALLGAMAPFVHTDFEAIARTSLEAPSGAGLRGLREIWLEWLAPWESYRVEVQDVLDAGDQAVVMIRDFGRQKGSQAEVSITAGAVWTVRDGRIARVEFYSDRAEALEAAGLSESGEDDPDTRAE